MVMRRSDRSNGRQSYRRFSANSHCVNSSDAYTASHELWLSPRYSVYRTSVDTAFNAPAGSRDPVTGTTASISPWKIQIGVLASRRARAGTAAPLSAGTIGTEPGNWGTAWTQPQIGATAANSSGGREARYPAPRPP